MLHSAQSCEVKVSYNDEVITSWLNIFCDLDCKCSCASAVRRSRTCEKTVPHTEMSTHVCSSHTCKNFQPGISAACQRFCIPWRFTMSRRKRQIWRTRIRHTQLRALSSTYPLPVVRMEWTLKAYLHPVSLDGRNTYCVAQDSLPVELEMSWHDEYTVHSSSKLTETRDGMNEAWKTWMEKRRMFIEEFPLT